VAIHRAKEKYKPDIQNWLDILLLHISSFFVFL